MFLLSQNLVTTEEAKKTDVEDLFDKLSSNEKGLSSSEVQQRLQRFGPNEITEKKTSPLRKFLGYFWGPIPWMIEAAVVMSAVIQHSHAADAECCGGFLAGKQGRQRYRAS